MKYCDGQWVSKDDCKEYIVCKSDFKRRWKPLTLGGLLMTLGFGVIIRSIWVDGCNAFEEAEYNALERAGIFTDINHIDTENILCEKTDHRKGRN